MSDATQHLLLKDYLRRLRLPIFVKNLEAVVVDAAKSNQPYDQFLLSLCEQELAQRDNNHKMQRIKAARLPSLKAEGPLGSWPILILARCHNSTSRWCCNWRKASI